MEIIQTENFLERDATLIAVGKHAFVVARTRVLSRMCYMRSLGKKQKKLKVTALH